MCLGDFKQMFAQLQLAYESGKQTVKVPHLHRTGFLRACYV